MMTGWISNFSCSLLVNIMISFEVIDLDQISMKGEATQPQIRHLSCKYLFFFDINLRNLCLKITYFNLNLFQSYLESF